MVGGGKAGSDSQASFTVNADRVFLDSNLLLECEPDRLELALTLLRLFQLKFGAD